VPSVESVADVDYDAARHLPEALAAVRSASASSLSSHPAAITEEAELRSIGVRKRVISSKSCLTFSGARGS